MRLCDVEGCEGKYYAKGYCGKHYNQIWYYGKLLTRTNFDPNEIIIKGDVAEVILYNIKNEEVASAIIDVEDVEKIKGYKWHKDTTGYVKASQKEINICIQHTIMGIAPNRKNPIDHKDNNKLNNRKSNFRFCTHKENSRNSKKPKNNTSGYKGVSWDKSTKKWRASITVNEKYIHLGLFTDIIDAARAYNEAAIKHHGEFAYINPL